MSKILIIEDNPTNMKLFSDLLESKGYDTEKVFDGEEGYEKLEKGGASAYDLVLLDIQLPKMDGFSLLEKARVEGLELPPIIIVSAFAMDHEISMAKLYKVKDYITKPIDIVKFMNTVDKAVKGE